MSDVAVPLTRAAGDDGCGGSRHPPVDRREERLTAVRFPIGLRSVVDGAPSCIPQLRSLHQHPPHHLYAALHHSVGEALIHAVLPPGLH